MCSASLDVMASLFFIKSLSGGLDKVIILSVFWWLFQTVKHQGRKRLLLLLWNEAGLGPFNCSHVLRQPVGRWLCLWETLIFFLPHMLNKFLLFPFIFPFLAQFTFSPKLHFGGNEVDGHCRVSLGCPLLSLKTAIKKDFKNYYYKSDT